MKRLVLLIMLSSLVLAQCIDNGICSTDEKLLGCSDCSFDNVCVTDGKCTSVELQAGCADCSATQVSQCIEDSICSEAERTLGNCADCQDKGLSTGLVLLVGGIGLVGFVVIGIIVAIGIAFYAMNRFGNKRIRM